MTITVRKPEIPEAEDVAFTPVSPVPADTTSAEPGGLFLSAPPEVAPTAKKSRWSFGSSKKVKTNASKDEPVLDTATIVPAGAVSEEPTTFFSTVRKAVAPGVRRKQLDTPVRVLIGYLPEVSQRDALEFAQGVAEKHCEQLSISFYAAVKMGDGYAYEVHEGGSGRGYLLSILKYYQNLPPFEQGEPYRVHIRTATRSVEVERTREGLASVLLPESEQVETTDWLEPAEKLRAAISQRTGMLVVGAVVFITGFCAMLMAQFVRHQPYLPQTTQTDIQVSYDQLPVGQWRSLQNLGPDEYIRTLRFDGKVWATEKGVEASGAASTPAVPPPPPAAMPGPAHASDVGPGTGPTVTPVAPLNGVPQ